MPRSHFVWRFLLGVMFILAGLNHFRRRPFYHSIMPPYLPWHGPLIAISGYAEIVLGGLVLVPRYQRRAGWGLIALLLAVFPANVHMARHPARYPGIPAWALWCRLPLQAVLIAWVHGCTHGDAAPVGVLR